MNTPKRVLTPSDVVVGGRYRGGKIGRIRVVEKITGFGWWVWCHWNSEKIETPAVVERRR